MPGTSPRSSAKRTLRQGRIGKRGLIKLPDGRRVAFRVTDEITRVQSDDRKRLASLQRIVLADGRVELRLGYYVRARRSTAMAQWVWGEYVTFLPLADFRGLVKRAIRRGWINGPFA